VASIPRGVDTGDPSLQWLTADFHFMEVKTD
jgi:hypothetical protein